MIIQNRELSQFAQYLTVEDSGNYNIGIAVTGAPFVGIGTTNPTSKFFVNGNAAITGILTVSAVRGSAQVGIASSGVYIGLTTSINIVGNGITITSQYNSTLGITTFTFTASNGGGSPGGAESQVQYFSGGLLAGSPNFTFNGSGVNIAGITTASRFISTVANGTAPLSVASSTLVTNLNADFLEGYNPASTNNPNTIVLRDVSGNFQAGSITANGFIGSIFDANTSRITTIYGTNSYYVNDFVSVGIITTLTNTNAFLNRVNITGIVTVANNPVLIGIAATTGTQAQRLQVEGKGYFSDNLGVANTNPSSRLSVTGDGAFTGIVTANTFSGNVVATNLSASGISTLSGSLSVVGSSSLANVSAGIITCTDLNSTSDAVYKKDVETITNALDIVGNLRGVRFTWKATDLPSMGVIAQELESVLPDLVSTSETKSVNYNGLIAILIEAVKELKEEVAQLKNNK
jgi:hypothetical protein